MVEKLKDIDTKVEDLQRMMEESTELILKEQKEMKSKLEDIDKKIDESSKDAAKRDLVTQNLIMNQGLEIKNMLLQKDGKGGSPSSKLGGGKWWPREQKASNNYLERFEARDLTDS